MWGVATGTEGIDVTDEEIKWRMNNIREEFERIMWSHGARIAELERKVKELERLSGSEAEQEEDVNG